MLHYSKTKSRNLGFAYSNVRAVTLRVLDFSELLVGIPSVVAGLPIYKQTCGQGRN